MQETKIGLYQDIMYQLVGAIYNVHNEMGPGLNEYVYQEALAIEFEVQHIPFEREKEIALSYRNQPLKATYRLDMVCYNNHAIIECKSVECLSQNHRAQLFNYMRLTNAPMGILVNFAQRNAVVERYFYDKETKDICDINGNPFSHK